MVLKDEILYIDCFSFVWHAKKEKSCGIPRLSNRFTNIKFGGLIQSVTVR